MAGARLLVVVEGQTEETFVNEVLAPHLLDAAFSSVSARILGNARLRTRRGGIRPWSGAKTELIRHLKGDRSVIVTTMVDYYRLPATGKGAWPGAPDRFEAAMDEEIQKAMGARFRHHRFVPFVVMHEFEGLLFSDCQAFARGAGLASAGSALQKIRDAFPTPEDINGSPQTHPSARVAGVVPGYQKEFHGNLAALEITIERIGTDGDVERAIALYRELDGQVDALGVGGIDLGMTFAGRYYPLHAAQRLVTDVRQTPFVDGSGLKQTLERGLAQFIEREIGAEVRPKRVLITCGVDRYGTTLSFHEAGYQALYGDLGFALGLPIPIRSLRGLHLVGRLLLPLVGRMSIDALYPTGEKQEQIVPRFGRWYAWATVLCGDCLYIKRHMPERLEGKVVATNTTTLADVAAFRERGVRYLVTSTPLLEGRSFGTNAMEAALVAAAGKGRVLTLDELQEMLRVLDIHPTLQRLNP